MNEDSDIRTVSFERGSLVDDVSPLHQINPQKGQTLRIALLDEFCRPSAANYHWYRSNFYRCNSRKDAAENDCCRHVQRSWTCVCLALVYLNANSKGQLERGTDIRFRVGYLSLSKAMYANVSEYVETPGCDLFYTNDGHYAITGASRTPRWKDSPQAAEVVRHAQRWSDGKKLIEKLGKKLTDEEWHRLITTGSTVELDED